MKTLNKLQKRVDEAKAKYTGNSLKVELTSILHPDKIVKMYYCEIWSTKTTSGGQGNKAGISYTKNCKNVECSDHKNAISFMMIPELRKEFKKIGIVI